MKHANYAADLKDVYARNSRLHQLLTGLTIALVLALLVIYRSVGSERIVVTPPSIDKTFWIAGERASNEYLEQMGGYVAWLILDVTPDSINWKKQALLRFASPDASGTMASQQDVEATRLKRLSASTYFLIQQVVPNEKDQSVVIIGKLRTVISGTETSAMQKRYLARFVYRGGRVHIHSFKEIINAS